MWRLSGAHSTLTRPSTPASIRAFHVVSRNAKMLTTPRRGQAARMYSEAGDHEHWEMLASAANSLGEGLPARTDADVEGVRSDWKEAVMAKVEELGTRIRALIAVR